MKMATESGGRVMGVERFVIDDEVGLWNNGILLCALAFRRFGGAEI
ncbi:hypothetical protein O9993_10250 [Vibrio lentus]|nr:hypothetical protein [Vibrio lentus]